MRRLVDKLKSYFAQPRMDHIQGSNSLDFEGETDENRPRTLIVNGEASLLSVDDVRRLESSNDLGIIRANALDVLTREPWNIEALIRMSSITTGAESLEYLLDAAKIDSKSREITYSIIKTEGQIFLTDHGTSSEIQKARFDWIFESVLKADIGEMVEISSVVTHEIYQQDPYRSRTFALSLFKSISQISENSALDYFTRLGRNLIDKRIKKTALSISKRRSRFLFSLRLLESVESTEEREYERMELLTNIAEIIFEGENREIEALITDCEGESKAMKINNCLLEIANYSWKVKDFMNDLQRREEGFDILSIIRTELFSVYERGRIYDFSELSYGKFNDDLLNMPLFSLNQRILHQFEFSDNEGHVIRSLKSILVKENVTQRRKDEIIYRSLGHLRTSSPQVAISLLQSLDLDDVQNERTKRIMAKIFEEVGDLETALGILSGSSHLASVSLRERLERMHNWIMFGYDLERWEIKDFDFESEPRKIMYCVHSCLPIINSGYTIRTEGVVSSLKSLGFDVEVFSRWGFPYDRRDYQGGELESLTYDHSGIRYTLDPDAQGMSVTRDEDYIFSAADSLLESALNFNPSIIYAASDHSIGLASALVASKLSIPFVYEMRGLWAYSRSANNPNFFGSSKFNLMMRLEIQCARSADRLFVISEALKEMAISWGIDPGKIEVIPNGINPDHTGTTTNTEEGPMGNTKELVVGYVGAIVPFEGLDLLVDTAELLLSERANEGIKFLIVGDGTQKQEIIDLVIGKGLSDHFEFTGKVPHEEIRSFYRRMDVVVIPRKSVMVAEIVPALKPLEAMKHGKLVVCSNVSPNQQLIGQMNNGMLFQKGSSESLAKVIMEIKNNPEKLEIGRVSRDWVYENRLWNDLMKGPAKSCARLMLPKIFDSPTPRTREAIGLIGMILNDEEKSSKSTDNEFKMSLNLLSKDRERKNSFLAFLRELGSINPEQALAFGKIHIEEWGDRRSISSMKKYAEKTGKMSLLTEIEAKMIKSEIENET